LKNLTPDFAFSRALIAALLIRFAKSWIQKHGTANKQKLKRVLKAEDPFVGLPTLTCGSHALRGSPQSKLLPEGQICIPSKARKRTASKQGSMGHADLLTPSFSWNKESGVQLETSLAFSESLLVVASITGLHIYLWFHKNHQITKPQQQLLLLLLCIFG
jgi:hypothetical protein